MIVREIKSELDIERAWELHSPPRSDKLHLTEIIRSLAVELGRLHGDGWDEEGRMRAETGFLWELVWCAAFGSRFREDHPGEVERDGIVGSPDGLIYGAADKVVCVEELKATWRSARRDVSEHWLWMTQIKGYCYMCDCVQANLRVLFINGRYEQPFRPEYRAYKLVFAQEELEDNWGMIIRHAKEKSWL